MAARPADLGGKLASGTPFGGGTPGGFGLQEIVTDERHKLNNKISQCCSQKLPAEPAQLPH